MIIFKTSANKISGGYTSLSWGGNGNEPHHINDTEEFLFSVDHLTTYRSAKTHSHLAQSLITERGPVFGVNSLIFDSNMRSGWSNTNEKEEEFYNIPIDSEGNSMLTGEGKQNLNGLKNFTCMELEVYQVVSN